MEKGNTMKQCGKVEKYLSRGRFGERLSELPESVRHHVEHCAACRNTLAEYTDIEDRLMTEMPAGAGDLSARARARIRQGISARTMTQARSRRLNLRWHGVAGVSFVAALLIAVLLNLDGSAPGGVPGAGQPSAVEIAATLDSDTLDALMEDLEPAIYSGSYYQPIDSSGTVTELDTLMTGHSDDDMIEAALDIAPPDAYAVYEDDLLTRFAELDESDLDALRRILS